MVVEVVAAVVSSGAAIVALVRSLEAWRTARRGDVTVEIQHGDRRVRIDLDDPKQAERFLREYLSRNETDEREIAE